MPLNNTAKNLACNAVTGVVGFVSLHNSDPGSTGTGEASGGSPAYARKAITWGTVASGANTNTNALVFDVPAGSYSHAGFWSTSTGGTFYGGQALSATETFAAQGTYTVAIGDVDLVFP